MNGVLTSLADPLVKQRLARFIRIVAKYRGAWAIAIATATIGVGMKLPIPFVTGYIIDQVIRAGRRNVLDTACLALIGATALYIALGYAGDYMVFRIHRAVVIRLQLRLFRHFHRLPITYTAEKEVGYLMSRITGDPSYLLGLVMQSFKLAHSVILLIVGLCAVFTLHAKMALICTTLLPFFAACYVGFQARIRDVDNLEKEQGANVGKELNRGLSSLLGSKTMPLEAWLARALLRQLRRSLELATTSFNLSNIVQGLSGFLAAMGPLIVVWYGGHEVMEGRLTIGRLVAFSSLLSFLYGPTAAIVNTNVSFLKALVSLGRVYDLLDLPTESELLSSGLPPAMPMHHGLEFREVAFEYTPGAPALRDINLTIQDGEAIGIVGPTGAGKSTLIRLIPLLLVPSSGAILLGGADTRAINLKLLRKLVSLMPQEPVLFSGSIYENILAGRPSATRAEVDAAAEMANASGFISALPKGMETQIGEGGYRISAGQKQLVGIARMILRNSSVVILDEPTSSLDSRTEELMLESLREFVRNRTTIVVSHRLSTTLHVDRTVILENGAIADDGPHDLLLERNEWYACVAAAQGEYASRF
jgi:subfamily B ATP-binding cassette protein MsbA